MAPKIGDQIATFQSVSPRDGNHTGLSRHDGSVGELRLSQHAAGSHHATTSDSRNLNMLSDFLKDFRFRMCNHVDVYYFNELYMKKCLKEVQDLYEVCDISDFLSIDFYGLHSATCIATSLPYTNTNQAFSNLLIK